MTQLQELCASWFERRGWEPQPFQREVWEAMAKGQSGLLHSSTGSGKTLAVWMGLMQGTLPRQPLQALWITPLRALAADTLKSLQDASSDFAWKVESRTGDTSASAKKKQAKDFPNALVITPESLSVLFSHAGGRSLFSNLELVVVDEWHELLGSKRGVMTELCLAELKQQSPQLKVWGLSATLGNSMEAAHVLAGPRALLISSQQSKEIEVDVLLPEQIENFPWAGHMGSKMVPKVCELLEESSSTLVFINTRAQSEIWFSEITRLRPDWKGLIALHHGSLSQEERAHAEEGLKTGTLKAVVATSSLDLGVDFSPVEQVIQVGSPKGIARLMQRAGRSGHQPGKPSRIICVPTHGLELLDLAAARIGVAERRIESRQPVKNALDVLSQHLVTLAAGDGFDPVEEYSHIKQTHAFQGITQEEWDWCLEFITQGGPSLQQYPHFRRVAQQGHRLSIQDPAIAKRHRLNIGTITSESMVTVQYLKGKSLGMVEESFASRLKPGDVFAFSGKVLATVMIKDMTVYVRSSSAKTGTVPRYAGGRLPLSTELSKEVRKVLEMAGQGELPTPELKLADGILNIQASRSGLPERDQLLIESIAVDGGTAHYVFPIEGRLVHEGVATLVAYRLTQTRETTLTIACNDYGFELFSPSPIEISEQDWRSVLSPDQLAADLMEALNSSELAKRQFREIARIAGLVFQGYPGAPRTAKHTQASSGLLYDVFQQYDPRNKLLNQALQEVLEKQLEQTRLKQCLDRIQSSRLLLTQPAKLTPFAFPLFVDRLRESISSESLESRINRILAKIEVAE